MKKQILEGAGDEALDALRENLVLVAVFKFKDSEIVNVDTHLISAEIRAIVDVMLYVACYGHKDLFEERLPPAGCLAFTDLSLKIARDKAGPGPCICSGRISPRLVLLYRQCQWAGCGPR